MPPNATAIAAATDVIFIGFLVFLSPTGRPELSQKPVDAKN
jgi:hypothetical protein